ncbi:MAG TPA: efflux RND transporter permease subunit, partial [Rhabdaerophilum sp.]|nr:efflux RND transporter permease subunit [Rhabdaerophilum sp.]
PMKEAIVEATVRRARPVVLTAAAAILAMIPLSGSAFWGPMAFTIMGGLFIATFLTLLFLPALYAFWFRSRMKREAREADAKARLEAGNSNEPSAPPPIMTPALPRAAE